MRVSKLILDIAKLSLGIAFTSCGIVATFKPLPVTAAEKITFSLSFLGEFSLSVEDMEIFAKKGEITSEFAYYANFLDKKTLQQLRQILQTSFAVEPITVYRLTNMPMGEDFLRRLGNIIYTHPQRNGLYAIRAALILAAGEPEGLTAINFLRHFPTDEMQLNTDLIFAIVKEAESFFRYKDTSIKAIAEQAQQEINSQTRPDFANLPDLRQPGQYQVSQETLTFPIDDLRQTAVGFAGAYDLNVDIYAPKGLTSSAPLAIIAHGLGSQRSDFAYLAEHLASHGYIVAIPEHAGSSSNYQEAFLRGEVNVDVSPFEFYSRPRDITHLLDRLEQHPDYQKLINWSQIGVLGHSFGGTTALITSGAPVNLARVKDVCDSDLFTLNVSLFLQCRANNLPPGEYDLQDDRIKAVVALNPVTSSVLGIESMQQINIPTLIVGGTMDFVAPFIPEQAHPFLWLTTPDKYLATMVNGSHFSTINEENIAGINDFLKGFRPDLGRDYLKALTLAFFEAHIKDSSEYQSYLTAAYAENISNPELPLHLIQSLTPEQLELAYGDTPPTSPIPEPIVAVASEQNRDILAEIKQTGTLKVAMRTDAAPFGYTDHSDLTGFCADLAVAFGDRLTQELNTSTPIKVVKIPSSVLNRFELVEKETVHLECGPNSIVSDREEVVFSDPFFSSGTRFLVNQDNAINLDLDSQLEGTRLGVLEATTTKQFLQQNYPNAEIVSFESADGRSKAIQAVRDGYLDAFVSDRVLLTGEIDRQGLGRENYQAIPEQPLTCDYYGLILPQGDSQWRNTINTFLHEHAAEQVFDQWLENYYPQAISDLDYCQNQRKQ
ncbi:alpha/beta hydrolase [Hyella patelloides]|nr:alpha/beta hydrolase [Hyella patelloides]